MNIALYRNGRYTKAAIEDGHLIEDTTNEDKFAEFYKSCTSIDYGCVLTEEILESFNIPNLGYNISDTGVQVFDKTVEEYTEEELPVYVDVLGSIKKSKKWVPFKTPTSNAIEASRVMYKKVELELLKRKNNLSSEYVRGLIEAGNGVAYVDTRINYIYNFFDIICNENIKILFSSNGRYIIGKIATDPEIDLYVPNSLIPMVIGKGGQQIKSIASDIKARRINVKPL